MKGNGQPHATKDFPNPATHLRLIHTYHAVPMPFPCHAAKIVSFPFDLHIAAVFDSNMRCRARAMPRPCHSESDFSRPRHSAAWALYRHGMTCVN
jgi:hypothetical protein